LVSTYYVDSRNKYKNRIKFHWHLYIHIKVDITISNAINEDLSKYASSHSLKAQQGTGWELEIFPVVTHFPSFRSL